MPPDPGPRHDPPPEPRRIQQHGPRPARRHVPPGRRFSLRRRRQRLRQHRRRAHAAAAADGKVPRRRRADRRRSDRHRSVAVREIAVQRSASSSAATARPATTAQSAAAGRSTPTAASPPSSIFRRAGRYTPPRRRPRSKHAGDEAATDGAAARRPEGQSLRRQRVRRCAARYEIKLGRRRRQASHCRPTSSTISKIPTAEDPRRRDRNLIIDAFEIDGPLDVRPEDYPGRASQADCRAGLTTTARSSMPPRRTCGRCSTGPSAGRRPTTKSSASRTRRCAPSSRATRSSKACRSPLTAVLVSPHFLFRVEGPEPHHSPLIAATVAIDRSATSSSPRGSPISSGAACRTTSCSPSPRRGKLHDDGDPRAASPPHAGRSQERSPRPELRHPVAQPAAARRRRARPAESFRSSTPS